MRLVFLYLSFVGIPILGVVGILRLGEKLTAPISVGGAWSLEVSPPSEGGPTCGDGQVPWVQPVLTVSQSGPYLLLTFNDHEQTTLAGEIHGATVTAQGVASATIAEAAASNAAAAAYLEASVDRQAEPSRLRGVITTTQCSQPTTLPFIALRQPDQGQ